MRHGDPLGGGAFKPSPGEPLRWLESAVLRDTDECIDWPFGRTGNGYGHVRYGDLETSSHRVVCIIAYGDPPTNEHDAAHSCRSRLCCNKRHLRWATKTENQADRLADETHALGERNSAAVIGPAEVVEIRNMRGQLSQQRIADMYGITKSNVSAIQLRKSWGHIA